MNIVGKQTNLTLEIFCYVLEKMFSVHLKKNFWGEIRFL